MTQTTRCLITGLTGQDGYYLARNLLGRGLKVLAGVRPDHLAEARRLAAEELGPIELFELDLASEASCADLLRRAAPDVIYHLAAQSSAGISWREPVLTAQVNALGTLYLLEGLRRHAPAAAFVLAGSCDCFDHDAAREGGLTPATPFKATNPYAASKVMAHQLARCYRDSHGLRVSVAILFNHTSPRRPTIFVERGIVSQAVRVSRGLQERVALGSLATRRDWAWAEDVMEGFARLGLRAEPAEVVLASGQTRTTEDWVRAACAQLGLDPARHVQVDPGQLHLGDRPHTFGNIELARQLLDWVPTTSLEEMARRLIEAEQHALAG